MVLSPDSFSSYILFAQALFIISILVTVFVIDLEHFLILDQILWIGLIGVLLLYSIANLFNQPVASVLRNLLTNNLLGAIAACLPFFAIWYFSKGQWMGFGDVKLAGFLGFTFGWPLVAVNLMLAVCLGGIVATFLLALQRKTLKSRVPFGTFLSLAAVITLYWGRPLLDWYLSLMGL